MSSSAIPLNSSRGAEYLTPSNVSRARSSLKTVDTTVVGGHGRIGPSLPRGIGKNPVVALNIQDSQRRAVMHRGSAEPLGHVLFHAIWSLDMWSVLPRLHKLGVVARPAVVTRRQPAVYISWYIQRNTDTLDGMNKSLYLARFLYGLTQVNMTMTILHRLENVVSINTADSYVREPLIVRPPQSIRDRDRCSIRAVGGAFLAFRSQHPHTNTFKAPPLK